MPSDFFLENPVNLSISRSKFSLSHKNTVTFSPGRLVPILSYSDVLPGDTFKLDCSFVCRSTTPIAPVMDDADIQIEFYFVPHKLVLSRAYMSPSTADSNHSFAAFIGAQDSLLNMPLPGDIQLPALNYYINSTDPAKYSFRHSVMHYLGYPYLSGVYGKLPAGVQGDEVYMNPLPALAFYAVWNENYRDPNLFAPVTFSITNGAVVFTVNPDAKISSSINGNTGLAGTSLPPVCRYHGYFGSCLPWPQRNSASVTLPLGTSADLYLKDDVYSLKALDGSSSSAGVQFGAASALFPDGDTGEHFGYLGLDATGNTSKKGQLLLNTTDVVEDVVDSRAISSTNIAVNLEKATAASINTIRTAFAYQRWFEMLARSGNRIQDVTRMFGVIPHDMAEDRPVYLGGKRLPLTQTQVENTSGTSYSTSTQQSIGSTGAFSLTSGSDHYFTKSFDTWGTLVGVCCVRCKDSFSNMLPKMLTRKNRFDFYWPQFANLGEQPVLKSEMDASNAVDNPTDVFGYQEYAAEYRYIPDRVTGEVNGDVDGTVLYWTYSNYDLRGSGFDSLKGFLDASGQVYNFDQTLQVADYVSGFTFLAQFYFNIIASRPMPMYSIPGLLDHH